MCLKYGDEFVKKGYFILIELTIIIIEFWYINTSLVNKVLLENQRWICATPREFNVIVKMNNQFNQLYRIVTDSYRKTLHSIISVL